MGAQNHHDGKTLAGRHTTVSEAVKEVIRGLRKLPGIRIRAGFIKSGVRASQRRIVLRKESNPLSMTVIGNGASQEVSVYGDVEAVKKALYALSQFLIIER